MMLFYRLSCFYSPIANYCYSSSAKVIGYNNAMEYHFGKKIMTLIDVLNALYKKYIVDENSDEIIVVEQKVSF